MLDDIGCGSDDIVECGHVRRRYDAPHYQTEPSADETCICQTVVFRDVPVNGDYWAWCPDADPPLAPLKRPKRVGLSKG